MATHASILAWRIPWMEEPGRLHSPWGRKESDTTERLPFHYDRPEALLSMGNGGHSSGVKPKKLKFVD